LSFVGVSLNLQASEMPKLISLFTGAGGLDLGLESAGFETFAASELEPYACQTLRANKELSLLTKAEFEPWIQAQVSQKCYKNIPIKEVQQLRFRLKGAVGRKNGPLKNAEILEGDIRLLSSETLMEAAKVKRGEIDLIAGGPPCQPFSRAGKRENVECDTGKLFKEFVRIVDDLRPRWFLFENVKGLVITKTDLLHLVCENCGATTLAPFEARIGDQEAPFPCPRCSSFEVRKLWSNVRGGSLQIILNEFEAIGYKCYWKVLNAADFGAPQIRERLFIVGSRDAELFAFPKGTFSKPISVESSQQPDLAFGEQNFSRNWRTMYESLWKSGHPTYGKLDRSTAVLWVKNVVRPHDEPVTWSLNRPSPTIGAHQSAKLAIAPLGVSEAQLQRQQWHTRGHRQSDLPCVFVEHTYLSDDELLKLQTFPADWYLFGTRMQRAFQIGNAVPPLLAEAVGCEILKSMSHTTNASGSFLKHATS